MDHFSWAVLLGGLAFFFFGLYSLREGLQLAAGDRLRTILLKLTDNRFKAFGFGALVTMLSQSSSATTAMLVSFADAGLLTLTQAFGVILGADVGTTAVVFLLAARGIADFALFGVAFGFALYLWVSRPRWRYVGQILFGFGLVFHGITMVVHAMHPLQESPLVKMLFTLLADSPFWAMIGAAIFAAIVHSSAATLGLALSLAFAGVITLEGALPLVLGANIGTTITALIAALDGNENARRVAGAHVITKLTGALVAFPLIGPAAFALQQLTQQLLWLEGPFQGALGLQIALAHLGFNLGLVLLFLPFLPFGVRLTLWCFPEGAAKAEPFGPRYLDKRTLQTPSLAFAQVHREVLRMGNLAHELLCDCIALFDRGTDFYRVEKAVEEEDDKIDSLEKAVRFFLAELSREALTVQQSRTQAALLSIASDLEEIGDTISKDMLQQARKCHDRQRSFSEGGWIELRNFHDQLDDLFAMTMGCLTTRDASTARKVGALAASLHTMEEQSRMAHLQRLSEGLKESVETSSVHLDLLSIFLHIANKLAHIATQSIES